MKHYKANPELLTTEGPLMIEDPEGGWVQRKEAEARLEKIKAALGRYVRSEGCSCCQDSSAHDEAADELGELLGAPRYEDFSGYNLFDLGRGE